MTADSPRPKVFASRCLGFAACRWDGTAVPDRFIETLKPDVDFVTACPEVGVGLRMLPRAKIRIVLKDKEPHLIQSNTGRDLSSEIRDFAKRLLDSLKEVDGFILKARSPSCGIGDVDIYSSPGSSVPISKGNGLFAAEILKRFPGLPIETEERLKAPKIRENFRKRLFAQARSRKVIIS